MPLPKKQVSLRNRPKKIIIQAFDFIFDLTPRVKLNSITQSKLTLLQLIAGD